MAGGEIPPDDITPNLKKGTIRIPEIGFNRKLQWYTIGARGQGFAGKPDITPELKLKDWTAEFLVKRNGPKWPDLVVTTQFAGFHSRNKDSQVVRILMNGPDTGKFIVWIEGKPTGKGGWFGADKLGIDIGEKEWHWIAFVFTNSKSLETYQDGKKMGTIETDQNFDNEDPVWATVFSAWDHRAFNGSISIVRIYDRPLSEKELNQNITGDLAVDGINKLATTWAELRAR